jgi:eukaryotic-like serine/threonine-protein kinase
MTKRVHLYVSPLRLVASLSPLLLLIATALWIQFRPVYGSSTAETLLAQPLIVRWRYDSNVTLNLTPAFDDERIYLPLAGGTIVALKAKDGQLYWRSDMGGELSASPVADESMVYVASEAVGADGQIKIPAGALRALGREGGVTQWMTPLVKPLRGGLAVSGGRLFAGGVDGRAYAFDKRTGGVFWSIPFGSAFSGRPTVDNTRVYLGSEDGTMLALESSTGKLLWKYRTKGAIRGSVAVADGTVFFGSADGYVYGVSADKGRLVWRKRTGGGVEAVALADGSLIAASLDNFAYLLNLKGGMVWKRLLPGRISSQPLVADGAALFTPLSSSAAVVLALRDGKQVNSLPTGEEMTSTASPIRVGAAIILTTEHGLIAFAPPLEAKAN